jgi:glucose-1-phosphate cytidylyltransferase
MEVVILCGGLGTRLREETEFRPKPMVKIGSKPILWHIMKHYAVYGHKDFILALGYKGKTIKDYFCNYEVMNNDLTIELGRKDSLRIHGGHEETGWMVTLVHTGSEALKGARLKKVARFVRGDVFMATYGDGVSDVKIDELIKFHKAHGKIATLTGVNPAAKFGELRIRGEKVEGFFEKPEDSKFKMVNGGFFVFNRDIFDYLTTEDECDLERGTLEKVAQEGELMIFKHRGYWACMDTIRDVEYLNRLWDAGEAKWKLWK